MNEMRRILKYGLIILKKNKFLVQKEIKQDLLLLPGGKPKKKETPEKCLTREILEEIKAKLDEKSLRYLGKFEDTAADGKSIVTVELYTGQLLTKPKTSRVVRRLVWFGKKNNHERLSPVIRNKVMPYLTAVRMIR